MPKPQKRSETIMCGQCRKTFLYTDVKWLPDKTRYFNNKNFNKIVKEQKDKSIVESLKKKRNEMMELQKRFHRDNYDSIIDDFIDMHKIGIEDKEIARYKIHMLNIVRDLRNNLDDDMKRHVDNLTQYPGLVFGCYEFQYISRCPLCAFPIILVWCGHESLERCIEIEMKDDDDKSTLECLSCGVELIAEHHIWRRVDTDRGEFLETICQRCDNPQLYPYDFNSFTNVVKSGGPYSKIQYEKIPKWMITKPRFYLFTGELGVIDSQIYTVPGTRELADGISHMFTSWKD